MNTIIGYKVTKLQSTSCKKQKLTISTSIIFSLFFSLFFQVKDTTQVNKLDEVLVSAVRVTTQTPVSFSNLDKIKFRNLGQDIPILMNYCRL
jgi:iron complex outermembrane receptor protein